GQNPAPLLHLHGNRLDLERYRRAFAAFEPEVVVDAIAASGLAAQRTLRSLAGLAQRIVFLSSMDVYRACGVFHGTEQGEPEAGLLNENAPLRANPGLYPASVLERLRYLLGWLDEGYDKVGMERAASAWSHGEASRGEVTIVRLPQVYGPGDYQHRLYPLWRRMRDGRRAILLQRGWAEWRSPRGYVDNMAAGIALAATAPHAGGRVYNLADARHFSEAEWAQQVGAAWGWSGRVVVATPEHMPPHLRVHANTAQQWMADSSRIRRELGYRERVELPAALAATLAWEQAHPPQGDDSGLFDYASEDAVLRGLGMAAEAGAAGGKRTANRANSAAITISTQ
ncbi:MAG: NAD-dependent epimerase/dehydratase family protein, partial [Streptosporangiaceae bacterium]